MARAKLPRRGPWLALASAAVFAALAWVVQPRVQRWRAESRAEEELSALASCLLSNETASDAELRRRVIGAALTGDDWPARCGVHATAAEVALTAAQREPDCRADPRCEALARTRALLSEVRAGRVEAVAPLLEHARAIGLLVESQERPLPEPAERIPEAPPLFAGGATERAIDPATSQELRLLFRDEHRARLCALHRERGRCWKVPLRDGLSLPSAEPNAPPMLIDGDGIFEVDKGLRLPVKGDELQAHVARNGAVHAVSKIEGAWWWLTENERRPLALERATDMTLVGHRLLWRDGDALLHLEAGREQRIGTVDLDEPAVQSCGGIVLFSATRGTETKVTLAIRHDLVHATVPSSWFGFTCRDDRADLSWIEPESEQRQPAGIAGTYGVMRMRCLRSGCKLERDLLSFERHGRASRYFVASLGSTMAVLWRSPLGDVRLRIAPLGKLATASDRSLFDDAEHGGFDFDDGNTELFVRDDTGYLLVERLQPDKDRAVHGFSIDARGNVLPLGHRQ